MTWAKRTTDSTFYKVWVSIEQYDGNTDTYIDDDFLVSLGVFNTIEEARKFVACLPEAILTEGEYNEYCKDSLGTGKPI